MSDPAEALDLAVIGGGPAGLAAAEAAAEALGRGRRIALFEAKPSHGRKLLMAGKSGLNITHGGPLEAFLGRYRAAAPALRAAVEAFPPAAIRDWMDGLGQPSFQGPSGRVFPNAMKASPLLRAWSARLGDLGVETRARWRWTGFEAERLIFETPLGRRAITARAAVLALGGASWPRLGSDGAWTGALGRIGARITPFAPSNVGWEADFSPQFLSRFDGAPVKGVRLIAEAESARGELTVTRYGLEGGPLYTLTPPLRAGAEARLDLSPDRSAAALAAALAKPRGKQSFSNWMRKAARLDPIKIALLREVGDDPAALTPEALAARIKACPLALRAPRPLTEAISTAGGLDWSALTADLELAARPGVFAAGEMIAWDAPTGGWLMTACLALGRKAGRAAALRIRA